MGKEELALLLTPIREFNNGYADKAAFIGPDLPLRFSFARHLVEKQNNRT